MPSSFHYKPLIDIVYLIVENDIYELPVYLAENLKEVQVYFGITSETAIEMIVHEKTRFNLKVEMVILDE